MISINCIFLKILKLLIDVILSCKWLLLTFKKGLEKGRESGKSQ